MFFTVFSFSALAQRTVSGKVTDDSGEGLPGVNVVIKGTTTGVITDLDGNYRLSVDDESFGVSNYFLKDGITLVFSFVGFETQEVQVGSKTTIDITMGSDATELDEVVITGYGSTSKRLYTGASQSLDIAEVQVKGIGDVSQMLQGRAAGVSVQSVSGTFGAGPKITIRGASSITGDGNPLWVIDGVVQEDLVNLSVDDLVSGNALTMIGSSVAGLNPNDIESFEILKDASATSLYGSRSLNGVIVITTKQGRKSQPLSVSYSGEYTVRSVPSYRSTDILDSKENVSILQELENKGLLDVTTLVQSQHSGIYGILSNRISTYDPHSGKFLVTNTPSERNKFLQPYERANTNWFDVLFKPSMTQNHTISLNGGGDDNSYYTSLGLYTDPGWTVSDKVSRLTLNLRNTMFMKNDAKLTLSLLGSYRQQLAPGSFNRQLDNVFGRVSRNFDINPYSYVLNTSRTLRPRDNNGDLEYYTFNYAPFNILKEVAHNYIDLRVQDVKFQTDFEYPLLKKDKLKYAFTGALRYANSVSEHNITEESNVAGAYRSAGNTIIRDRNPFLFSDPENVTRPPVVALPAGGIYIRSNNFLRNFYVRNSLTFSETFDNRHELDIFLGQEVRYIDREATGFTGYGLIYGGGRIPQTDPNILAKVIQESGSYFSLGSPLNAGDRVGTTRERTASFFSRIIYGFDGKYFGSFTGNMNASNRQGLKDGKPRWTPTYTISGKWNLKEEIFLANIKTVTVATLRGSYGLTANTGIASNTLPILRNRITDRQNISDRETTVVITSLQNDDLTWENQFETNIGMDIGLIKNQVSLSVDVYERKGFDLFDYVKTSGIGGEGIKLINNADMKTKGLELSLRTTNLRVGDFEWVSTVNFSMFDQKITKLQSTSNVLDLVNDTGASLVGFPRNSLFSLKFEGLDTRGLPTYDIPGPDKVSGADFQDTGTEIEATESKPGGLLSYLKYEGPTEPNKAMGFQNTFSYKNWSLGIFVTASGGNKIRLPPFYSGSFTDVATYTKSFINRWVLPGDEEITDFPVIPDSRLRSELGGFSVARAYNAYNYSTARVADGTFVRLRTVNLSYRLPKSLLEKFNLNSLTISGLVQNPWLIYSDQKLNGVDPEFYSSGGVAQPITRQYTASLNIGI